ncbi:polyketide synthase dehydratase domain-containing protein [Thermodesulfobacteriota bacterium]
MKKDSAEHTALLDPVTILKNRHRKLTEAHQDFLTHYSRAQEAYLSVCRRSWELLCKAGFLPMEGPCAGDAESTFRADRLNEEMFPCQTLPDKRKTYVHHWAIELDRHKWIGDHQPTFVVPVLPVMFELDMMCRASASFFPKKKVVHIKSAESRRWAAFDGGSLSGRTLVKEIFKNQAKVELQIQGDPGDKTRFETAAACRIVFQDDYPGPDPERIPDLKDETDGGDPYRAGILFHGPSLQLMTDWVLGQNGAHCRVMAESRGVPYGMLHPGLLDSALHCIPFYHIKSWYPEIAKGKIALPLRMESFFIYDRFPQSGVVDVEARKERIDDRYFPVIKFWIKKEGRLLAVFNLILTLLPEGSLRQGSPLLRKAFLKGECYVEDIALTRREARQSILSVKDAKAFEWLPGTLSKVYGLDSDSENFFEQIAVAEHCARHLKLHPSRIIIDKVTGRCANLPLNAFHIRSIRENGCMIVGSSYPEHIDIIPVQHYWSESSGVKMNILFDLLSALVKKFVRRVILEDPIQFKALKTTPVMYLANHQTGIESLLFACLTGSLAKTAFCGIGNQEQQYGLLGVLNDLSNRFIDTHIPLRMLVFNQKDHTSLHSLLDGYATAMRQENESLYAAVEGRRAVRAGHNVTRLSSVFIDFALKEDLPIIPVRFAGGLPKEGNSKLFDFPYDYGQQDYYFGRAVYPSRLHPLAYADRPKYILNKINLLGPQLSREAPFGSDRRFNERVVKRTVDAGISEFGAMLIEALSILKNPCDETRELLKRMKSKPDFTGMDKNSLLYAVMCILAPA